MPRNRTGTTAPNDCPEVPIFPDTVPLPSQERLEVSGRIQRSISAQQRETPMTKSQYDALTGLIDDELVSLEVSLQTEITNRLGQEVADWWSNNADLAREHIVYMAQKRWETLGNG